MRSYLLLLVIFLLLYACNHKSGRERSSKKKARVSGTNTVTYIVDGDTFDVTDSNGNIVRIRPIGINADELHDNPHGKKGPFAQQAKHYLSGLIYHKQVRLEMDIQKTDQYKRRLAYVFVDDTLFVNAEMIKQGYAMIETEPPNIRYADLFLKLQQEARENRSGLWKDQTR